MMIEILMATYNASKYIEQQLDSIFSQTHSDFYLTIRDNHSSDNTCDLIRKYAEKYPITLIEGTENLGALGNFAYLSSISKGDYVMFSDADDVWLADKILLSYKEIKRLEGEKGFSTPLLVHTDLSVVDKNLHMINKSFWNYSGRNPNNSKQLNKIILQNSVTGSTIMANRALLEKSCPIPKEAIMHDWWLALVACAFGSISSLSESTILYRQHDQNVLGALPRRRLNAAWFEQRHTQAKAFYDKFEQEFNSEQKSIVAAYLSLRDSSWWNRRRIIVQNKFFCNTLSQNIGMLLLG